MLELLVVMAIIFILAGLSVGSYQKIRQSSLRASCMSNLKSISYSMCMYLSDHDSAMIQYENPAGDKWTTILVSNEYLHEGNYFEPIGVTSGNARDVGLEPLHCPSDMSDMDVFFQDKYAAGGSYAINRDITSSPTVERKWTHIKNAHNKVLLCDYNQQGMLNNSNQRVSAGSNNNNWKNGGSKSSGTVGTPHLGGSNCLFADWHVAPQHFDAFEDENFSLETNFN
ncbi:MAG: type II secretion system protein [Candidatus Auribacterota bacterium]|jgi:prepilin-type processing-associated H-X9-DG protein|nr:type II secretion system protein [Candidatus Auribacterota bacterium]